MFLGFMLDYKFHGRCGYCDVKPDDILVSDCFVVQTIQKLKYLLVSDVLVSFFISLR